MSLDPDLISRLRHYGQEHLLAWRHDLSPAQRIRLETEIAAIDFEQLGRLLGDLVRGGSAPSVEPDRVRPIEVLRQPQTDGQRVARRRAMEIGAEILAAGEVALIVVAGGAGTRLGFEGPKGTFPIGPVSSASLFQIHAEKIVALGRRHGRPLPLYVMTSPENHAATISFFEANGRFGLDYVRFFTQGQMPAVDRVTGKVLLAAKDRVALSPDGHGGRWPRWPPQARMARRTAWTRCAIWGFKPSIISRWTIPWPRLPIRPSWGCTGRQRRRCRSRSSSGSRLTKNSAWSFSWTGNRR